MSLTFGQSLDTSFLAEVRVSSNIVLELASLKLSGILPKQRRFRFLAGPRNTHLSNHHQRFGCPLKFGNNWFSD